MAVTATFLPGSGTLSVFGDGLDNTIITSRNAAGEILSMAAPCRSRRHSNCRQYRADPGVRPGRQ